MKLKTLTESSGRAIDALLMNGHNPQHPVSHAGESPAQLAAAAKVLNLLGSPAYEEPAPNDSQNDGDLPPYLAERTVENITQQARSNAAATAAVTGEFR